MPRFRSILATRHVGAVTFKPNEHNPTGLGNVIRHQEVYDHFVLDAKGELRFGDKDAEPGDKVDSTEERCAAIEDAIEKKYGQKLVTFEVALSANELAAERKELAELRALKAAGKLGAKANGNGGAELAAAKAEAEKLRAAAFPVNANTGSLAQLMLVPGIGEATAEKIIARRGEKPFDTLAELATISPTTLNAEKLAEHVVL